MKDTDDMTISEMIDSAIKLEHEAIEFYLSLSHKLKNPVSKKVIKTIAEQEMEHLELFERIKKDSKTACWT